MLVSPSDFKVKLERTSNSSQSTSPVGQVLWEELLILSRFQLLLRTDEVNLCPLQYSDENGPFLRIRLHMKISSEAKLAAFGMKLLFGFCKQYFISPFLNCFNINFTITYMYCNHYVLSNQENV